MVNSFAVDSGTHPFCATARDILVTRIEERSGARCREANDAYRIRLDMDEGIAGDGFRIGDSERGVVVSGATIRGLMAGMGRFLRTCTYSPEGFTPSAWCGESLPASDLRGMYFATHFQNWYHVASEEEIVRYVEDLALWGMSHLKLAFPIIHLTGWDDPEVDVMLERVAKYRRICQRLGVKIGVGYPPNQDFFLPREEFAGTPNRDDFGRKGDHGNNICPSKPGATEYIMNNYDGFLKHIAATPMDFFTYWPYDEGGCGCDECFPWGGNGYLRLCRAMAERARKAFPNIKLVLSTWVFDTPEAGEWEALSQSMREHGPWVDYILADAHEDFPRYPLDVEVPGGLPLVNFPEISMWGLGPWGGFGANPLPARFQRLWDQVKHVVRGGFPYSEGIYEDVNKTFELQFYWDPERTAEETLREYANYELPGAAWEDVLTLMQGIEANHVARAAGKPADLAMAEQALGAAHGIDKALAPAMRESWRWRILHIRAVLDRERYAALAEQGWPDRYDSKDLLKDNAVAQEAFRELMTLFHCREEIDPAHPQHAWVRPPIA